VNQRPDHEEIDALLALRALGGIEPDDDRRLEAAMATHGPQCPECRRLERAHAEVAARLAVALDPSELPDGLEDRVVSELRRSRPRPRRGLPIRRIAAVAAAAVLAFAAGWAARGIGGPAIPETLAGSRVVVLRGSEAHLSVAYRPGRSGAFLFGSDLPAAPSGRVYELWIIRGGRPIPQTCFEPHGAGGAVLEFVDAEPRSGDTIAVTVEPSACPSAPTSEPVLSAPIGPV
jgi:anti-sigma-K factor RskA